MVKITINFIAIFAIQFDSAQKLMKEGDLALDREQYAQAIKLYTSQIEKSKSKKHIIAEAHLKTGYCYKKTI